MSTSTIEVNGALAYILAFCVLLFIMIVFFMIYYLVLFRKSRNPIPEEVPGSTLIEALWVIVPTILVMTMFIYGLTGFRFLRNTPADSISVKVNARQWSWLFEYQNGKKSPDLVVPLGKDIKCDLVSADVIHGFYIPAFRIQQDALPGMKTQVWFKAVTTGSFYILCSQYCGLKHSMMLAKLIVIQPDQFNAWLAGKKVSLSGSMLSLSMPPGERLLFERGCASCHSLDGSQMVGPTFKGLFSSTVRVTTKGKLRTVIADDQYIRDSIITPSADIVEGFPDRMPSGRDVLSDDEIDQIIKFLKTVK